jgi:hypothetical protein
MIVRCNCKGFLQPGRGVSWVLALRSFGSDRILPRQFGILETFCCWLDSKVLYRNKPLRCGNAGTPISSLLVIPLHTLFLVWLLAVASCDGQLPGFMSTDAAFDLQRDAIIEMFQLPDDVGSEVGDVYGQADQSEDPRGEAVDADRHDSVVGPEVDVPGLVLHSLEPSVGPADRSTTVTVSGGGFVDGMEVFFGARKGLYPFVVSDRIVNVTAPPADAGVVNVRAVLPGGAEASIQGAFQYVGAVSILAVQPASGPASGGTPVTIRGSGFAGAPLLLFGGREAPVATVVDDRTMLAITPPGDPGSVSVVAIRSDGQARLDQGFTFLAVAQPPVDPDLSILGCQPGSGPPDGGTLLHVTGKGFKTGVSVVVGVLPATDVVVLSDTLLTARTAAGSPGPARLLVFQGESVAFLDGAFEFASEGGPTILAVDPVDGSLAGGALVRLQGRNLSGVQRVFFGGGEASDLRVVSSVLVEVRSPRAFETGTVPLMVLGDGGDVGSEFTYFDPYLPGGGTWGGRFRDTLNVTVTNSSTGSRLADAYVWVGDDPHTLFQGRTDSRGQISLSHPGLAAPLAVTVGKEAFSAATIAGFDARNVTMSIGPLGSPENPELPPGSTGTARTCKVRGRVKDYGKYLVKPPWVEARPYVQCGTSASSMFGGVPDPGPGALPDQEGRFEILARTGDFAVVCQMLVVDPSRGWPVPVRIGVVRYLSCKADDEVDGVVVSMDVETEAELWLAAGTPPFHPMGTGPVSLSGSWELGGDGWLPLFQHYLRKGSRILFQNQPWSLEPPLDGVGYSFYATISAALPISPPSSTVLAMGQPEVGPWPVLLEDASGFAPVPTGLRREMTAMVRLDGGGILAADAGGATWEFDGESFSVGPYRTSRSIFGLYGTSSSDFWVVGARGMVRHVVGGVATDVSAPVSSDFLGISGDATDGISIAAGRFMLRFVGDKFVQENLPAGTDVKALRRFADGEIVAAGAGGAVVLGRSGGTFNVFRPVVGDLRAVDGLDPGEVWIVGDRGAVIRVGPDDITAFVVPGGPDLTGLVVLGPSNVLVFGPGGTIFQFDGVNFIDKSRADLNVDIMAGASAGGRVVLAGRRFMSFPGFLPFPAILDPVEQATWSGRRITWTLGDTTLIPTGGGVLPTHSQAVLSGATGFSFWTVTAGGDVREVSLPDLSRVLGSAPAPAGTKRLSLTVVHAPGFEIDAFGSMDLGFYRRDAYSTASTSFR